MGAPFFRFAALVLGTALVWSWLPALPWPARALTAFLLVPLPALMIAQLRLARDVPSDLPRLGVYASSGVTLWVLAGTALFAAYSSGFTSRLLGLTTLPLPAFIAWTLAAIGVLAIPVLITRALRLPETPLLAHLIPCTVGEKLGFVAVSVTAGVAEELVFRGFLITALTTATGSVWSAAVISSAAFGLLHTYQGFVGTVRAAVMGLALAVPFLVSGSLLPSMAAHAAFNIIAGVWLADWLLRR